MKSLANCETGCIKTSVSWRSRCRKKMESHHGSLRGIYSTDKGKITKAVTKEKWTKGRKLLSELKEEYLKNPNVLFSY